ncbi:MAG: energy-coupling factor transporter ATPase [Erysipelotrichaceae bacterium]|nr:energy-coupling factor transporter ATPase [Erysipelotrichaceae bacterium]
MIEVKNLSFSYNQKEEALKDVSFTVNDHEWISIIGHNGSGKSTIAKLLVGLIAATKGSILIDGVELNDKTVDSIRHKIGIVFQNPDNQFVGFNVKYDIAFGLENYKVERKEMVALIEEYTKKVDMYEYLEREPQTLSGGQKQRVAIAGILALNSDVIILDEATSMLDPEGTEEIIKLIKELHTKYNKTVITITHDLNLAQLSDRVIVMRLGEKIAEGKPEEIFKQRDLLVSSNLDMPFALKAYDEASKIEKLNNDKELMDTLWEYHLKK